MFRLERYLGHVDAIFARVFGRVEAASTRRDRRARRPAALRGPGSVAMLLGSLPGRARSSSFLLGRLLPARGRERTADRRSTTAWWPRSSARSPTPSFLVGACVGRRTACPLRAASLDGLRWTRAALRGSAVAARQRARPRARPAAILLVAGTPRSPHAGRGQTAWPREFGPLLQQAGHGLHRSRGRHHPPRSTSG